MADALGDNAEPVSLKIVAVYCTIATHPVNWFNAARMMPIKRAFFTDLEAVDDKSQRLIEEMKKKTY